MNLVPLPALQDNDLWLLHNGHGALAADPGDTQPVLPCLQRDGLQLEAILVMHHLIDHLGVDPPCEATGAKAYAPARELIHESLTRPAATPMARAAHMNTH
jgi:hydroxyacylglutathione hydrolase